MRPDPWGSRCRDELGRWIVTDDCGAPPPDNVDGVNPLTFAVGVNGLTRYKLEHRVVELRELTVSHDPETFEPNPDYPAELQPRLRERTATRIQVEKIAAHLEPDVLLTDFHVLDRGSPIVGPDLIVESGNGRVMAMMLAAAQSLPAYSDYVAELADRAELVGVTPEEVADAEAPVLVRVRLTSVDRRAFTQEANTAATISQSAIEQARTDADLVTLTMLNGLSVGETQSIEDALRSRTNRGFVQTFLQKLPDQEQARLVDAQGVLNQDGVRRTMMAVFVSAFPGDAGLRLAERAFESIDLDVRNVVNALSRSLGPLAQAEALVREGKRRAELAIGDDLAQAVEVFAKIKRTPGLNVTDYLAQQQLFERELTTFQETILVTIDERSRSARRMAGVFRAYAELVIAEPPPQQAGFFPENARPRQEVWESATSDAEFEPQGELVLSCDDGGCTMGKSEDGFRETATAICEDPNDPGRLTRGKTFVGDAESVKGFVPMCTAPSEPVAIHHTHPPGYVYPSGQDCESLRAMGLEFICVESEGPDGETIEVCESAASCGRA